jgi:membrane associated rhomboid family serine protease
MIFPYHDNNPTTRPPVLTLAIIVVNSLVWLAMWRMPPARQDEFVARNGFVPKRLEQLRDPGVVVRVPIERRVADPIHRRIKVEQDEIELDAGDGSVPLTLLTCMFLHGGWMHLIGNMWFLWLFGNNIEDRLGHLLFALLYLGGGLVATICHWAAGPGSSVPVIGASGAVAATLGAYAVTFPHARVRSALVLIIFVTIVELPAMVVLGLWFLGQLFEAFGSWNVGLSGGVAWWAHIGGFVAGAAAMPLLRLIAPEPPRAEDRPRVPVDW